ncbi:MAG: SAVED domain-containing protein [Sphingomonadales bacterium]|nr:SAVED domain-containing protein [Sphingomonadales bacterium]
MTEAVTVRRDGDTFQARMFWQRAARLLIPEAAVRRVAFELGPKSFDDIWVEYFPGRGQLDHRGVALLREHIQCKWHVAPGSFGYAHLIDPDFINANARSLLQRAYSAREAAGENATATRFKLLTNWSVDRNDPLKTLIGMRSGAIRANRLFDGTTDRSQIGGVRKLWRDHLGVDDAALQPFAASLAFGQASDSLDDLREQLDLIFFMAGMRRFSASESAFPYDDLIFHWMAQGRLEFDRESLHDALRRERLLADSGSTPFVFGVKSFEHALDPLELRCVKVLDLTPVFDDRFIHDETDWATTLYPRLAEFLRQAATDGQRLRLALDAHATLAFAAGAVLDIKCGRMIELEQRSPNRQVWAADDSEPTADWPTLETIVRELGPGADIAVAAGITHDIANDVEAYITANLPDVGRLLVCATNSGPAHSAVRSGRHASDLAAAVVTAVRAEQVASKIHLFLAAPNSFSFFLGQRRPQLGNVTLYEFDFEGGRDRSYRPSLSLPIKWPARAIPSG